METGTHHAMFSFNLGQEALPSAAPHAHTLSMTRRRLIIAATALCAGVLAVLAGLAATRALNMPPIGWVIAGPALLVALAAGRIAVRVTRTKS